MNKNLIVILVVACIVSVLNVVAVVNSNSDVSFQSFAESRICNAQGDFMPQPYDDLLIAPISPMEESDLFCSIQGDIMPPPFEDDEDTTTSTK
ncbi:MAG: hypothetical protein ISS80_04920 [Candidatus Cloacimonetes bacterium]|nr:hypothetical protein [Candidatus Cloacimonadota bacterium]